MVNDPLRIIDEYLSPEIEETAVRRNAVVALAVVGSEESVARLAGLALRDGDPSVRQKAEQEIALLPADLQGSVWRFGFAALASERTMRPAYALLGRLRCRGLKPPQSGLPWKVRAEAAISTLGMGPQELSWRFRWKPALLALLGALLGGVVLAALLRGLVGVKCDGENLALLLGAAPATAWLVGLALTQTLNPILLHYDRVLGAWAEVGRTALVSALVGEILLVLFWLVYSASWNGAAPALGLFLFFAGLAAAIRLGSLLGAFGHRKSRGRLVASFTSGAVLGWVAGTALALAAHRAAISVALETAIDNAWLVSMAATPGLALLLARIDRLAPVEERKGSFLARAATLGLGLVPALVLGLLAWPKEEARQVDLDVGVAARRSVVVREIPSRLRFEVLRESLVLASAASLPEGSLEIRREGSPAFSAGAELSLSSSLEPGVYTLTVRRNSASEGKSEDPPFLFTAFANRLANGLPPRFFPAARIRLETPSRLDLRFGDPGAGSCVMTAAGPVRPNDSVTYEDVEGGLRTRTVSRLDYARGFLYFRDGSEAEPGGQGKESQMIGADAVREIRLGDSRFRPLEADVRAWFGKLGSNGTVVPRSDAEAILSTSRQELPLEGQRVAMTAQFTDGRKEYGGVVWDSTSCLSCCAVFTLRDLEPGDAETASVLSPKISPVSRAAE